MTAIPIFGFCRTCRVPLQRTRRVIDAGLCGECYEAKIATMVAEEQAGIPIATVLANHPEVRRRSTSDQQGSK